MRNDVDRTVTEVSNQRLIYNTLKHTYFTHLNYHWARRSSGRLVKMSLFYPGVLISENVPSIVKTQMYINIYLTIKESTDYIYSRNIISLELCFVLCGTWECVFRHMLIPLFYKYIFLNKRVHSQPILRYWSLWSISQHKSLHNDKFTNDSVFRKPTTN